MATSLTTLGQDITYNGYTFPVTRRTEFTGKPKKDDARRTIVGVEYTIRIEFYVLKTAEVDASAEFDEIRDKLSKAGGKLTLSGLGLGNNISVNDASGTWDMAWGPFPELVSWKTLGGNTSFYCVWVCNFFINECSSYISGIPKNILAFNFRSNISIDMNRLATVTTDGYLEIALTRQVQGNRTIPDRAGRYRSYINVPLISNFTRSSEEFKETMDRRRLDFVIVDKARAPNELPWGCSSASAEHSAASGTAFVGGDLGTNASEQKTNQAFKAGNIPLNYFGRISASYTMLPGFAKDIAYMHFTDLLSNIVSSTTEKSLSGTNYSGNNGSIIKKFSVSEGLYEKNRQVNFYVEYMYLSSMNDIFIRSGFGKKEPNSNGDLWKLKWNQMYNKNFDIYGISFPKENDAIIDVCTSIATPNISPVVQPNESQLGGKKATAQVSSGVVNWIAYVCNIWAETDTGAMQTAELKKVEKKPDALIFSNSTPDTFGGRLDNQQKSNSGTIIQERRPELVSIYLYGGALRAGQSIVPPKLISIGGVPATPGRQVANETIIDNWEGIPIFQCTWCNEYFIDANYDKASVSIPSIPIEFRDNPEINL